MILPNPKDAIHKAWLFRTLTGISDDAFIASRIAFKGGTCAAMLGLLDRFSVDLDFDFTGEKKDIPETRRRMEIIFRNLSLIVRDQSKVALQYFLKYEAKEGERNTLKVDATFPPPKSNRYEARRFSEIDRIIFCQTPDTMLANKLVALMDRYDKHESIAGRDVYDIRHFFLNGLRYNEEVIRERTGKDTDIFFADLIKFIETHVTDKVINQDLNVLLPYDTFSRVRKTLKREMLMLLRDELARIS